MNILLTGATGFIGKALSQRFIEQGHHVYAWVRDKVKANTKLNPRIISVERLEEIPNPKFEVIINLAGEPIADKRWTPERKSTLRSSRIDLTQRLVDFVKSLDTPPDVVLSGSAIGFYGSQPPDLELDEGAKPVMGFTHSLCADWEAAAMALASESTRVCVLRTGVVLGKGGGALGKMLLPFKLGLGGPIGHGRQVMSWIHLQDWINAALFLIDNQTVSGPVNLVSPVPVTNQVFTKALGNAVHRPAFFKVPCFMLRLALGEAAELLCEGQRVIPQKLINAGFIYEFDSIEAALIDIVSADHS